MKSVTIEKLLEKVKEYNIEELEIVKKAYEYADVLHSGQFRQSGEPYIIHPLTVAYILAEMHADRDTLCAALLHDTLEDTKATKEDITNLFNVNVANLVDGVTKISKMDFSSKAEQNLANTRKIITGLTSDARIIIIKLADRLHNMRTLEYKTPFKQKENALETMEIFVPLAYYIGAYRIKSELEDLSFKYLYPSEYSRILDEKTRVCIESKDSINEMLLKIDMFLYNQNIPNDIKLRIKNIYGIWKRESEGYQTKNMHDLIALKIMVEEIRDCYITLGLIHSLYPPVNDKFKDYICNPKTNMYQSLHTTVFGLDNRLVQTQIRTYDMDRIASFGLTAYWEINKGRARYKMQEDLNKKFQFYKSLREIDSMFKDNDEFIEKIKTELFTDKVYVYTSKGECKELPKGSTIIDFAYSIHTSLGNRMVSAKVNGKEVPINYVLNNKDRVIVEASEQSHPSEEWLKDAHTSHAQKSIKKCLKRNKRL